MSLDILILGAGVAGLRAADLLSAAGRRCVILEARDRIGGRIHTISTSSHPANSSYPSHPLDLGAEFIHGRPPQTWKLIHQGVLAAYDVTDNHYFRQGRRLTQNCQFWEQIEEVLSRLPEGKGRDLSFDVFLSRQRKLTPAARRAARDFVRGFDAADTSKIGVLGLAAAQKMSDKIDGDLIFRPVNGYSALTDYFAERFRSRGGEIVLNTVVRKIEWSANGCRVSAQHNGKAIVYTARKILVTLPLGVLKAGDVAFSPDVPGLSASLAAMEMGPVIKILFRFRSAFWEEKGFKDLGFFHSSADIFPTWWTALPFRLPLLTAWCGGARASEIAHFNDQQLFDAALATLARCFNTSKKWMRQQIEEHHIANWPADPFARGAYSYVATGGLSAARHFKSLGESILFFAGEHTDPEMIGTVAAAIASAERIVPKMLSKSRQRHSFAR